MAGDVKETEAVELPEDIEIVDPFKPFSDAVTASQAAIVAAITLSGAEIIRLEHAQVVNQHPKLRVRYIVITGDTAAACILSIGAADYNFTSPVGLVPFPFPLVIERGVDIEWTGDGVLCYLIGDPE